jgi:carboxylate-amine ligase
VGVEEEFLLVDPVDGRPRALAAAVLRADQAAGGDRGSSANGQVEGEMQLQQIETATEPCRSLDDLHRQIRAVRLRAGDSAGELGAEIAALGTSSVPVDTRLAPDTRYRRIAERFGLTIQEQLTCGCHVHVAVDSDDEAVAVLDRIRPWLAPLLALSGNSPFWDGQDTGYASYRSGVWSRWPSAGPTELFGSADEYHRTVRAMVGSGTVLDTGMVYFDARLSDDYPTVEIRVADVCLRAEDAVLLAALVRGLVETAAREWRDGRPPLPVRVELLRLAMWRAGRTGLGGDLLDPRTQRPAPARNVLGLLLEHLRDALVDAGDAERVADLYDSVLREGTGADLQRAVYALTGRPRDVVVEAVRRTAGGSGR